MLGLQPLEHPRHQRVGGCRNDTDPDSPHQLSGLGSQLLRDLLRVLQPGAKTRCGASAQRRQLDAAARAIEEASPALVLELGDLSADVRLHRLPPRGDLAQAAGLGDFQEELD
jgi:hypothetical protein